MTLYQEYEMLQRVLYSRREKLQQLLAEKIPKNLYVIINGKVRKFRVLNISVMCSVDVDTYYMEWYNMGTEKDNIKVLQAILQYFNEDVPQDNIWIGGHYGSRFMYWFRGNYDYLDKHNDYYLTRKEAETQL